MMGFRINRFWSIVLTVVVVYALVKWGIPAASRQITTLPFPLSVPGTLMFIYMMLTVVALFLLVTFSDEYLNEFLDPIKKLLQGRIREDIAGRGPGGRPFDRRLAGLFPDRSPNRVAVVAPYPAPVFELSEELRGLEESLRQSRRPFG